jgi:hypothetical protein
MKTNHSKVHLYIFFAVFAVICYQALAQNAQENTMNDIAMQATLPSFYDQMILEWKLEPREVQKARIAEIEDAQKLKEIAEQIEEDMKTWLYFESQSPKCTSSVNPWIDDRLTYAYMISNGDMDFIGTVLAESAFDYDAVGDGWLAHWLCQWHEYWHKPTIREYRSLATGEEKIEKCYKTYKGYIEAWNIQNRLYGYNVRQEGIRKWWVTCTS